MRWCFLIQFIKRASLMDAPWVASFECAVFLIGIYSAGSIEPVGQTSTQAPQSVQSSGSMV